MNTSRMQEPKGDQKRTARPSVRIGFETEPRRETPRKKSPGTWKVNWDKVHEAERWLKRRGPDPSKEEIVSERRLGGVRISGIIPVREAMLEPDVHEAGLAHAINVFDILASRCAGVRNCPEATEVVDGIANATPTERQLRAIRVYIRACAPKDLRRAWEAGEFTLCELMHTVEDHFDNGYIGLMYAVHEWMEEESPC